MMSTLDVAGMGTIKNQGEQMQKRKISTILGTGTRKGIGTYFHPRTTHGSQPTIKSMLATK